MKLNTKLIILINTWLNKIGPNYSLLNFKNTFFLSKVKLAFTAAFIVNLSFNCTKAFEIQNNDKFLLDAATVTSPKPECSLSLKEAFSIGLVNNFDIIVAKKNLNIAYSQVIAAKAMPNPQFQAQLGFGPAFSYLFTGQTQQILFTELHLWPGLFRLGFGRTLEY